MDITAHRRLWDPNPGWLNTASYGLPPRPAFEALTRALDDWRHGRVDWKPWDSSTIRSREVFAELIGVPATDVAVGATVSGILAPVAAALPAGSRVMVPDIEFTSNVFPWLVQADRGVNVQGVPMDKLPDLILADKPDLVAFSAVQSASGEVAPFDAIVEAARSVDARIVVDATQAVGWRSENWAAADVVAVGAYKWLMSPRGSVLTYLSPSIREVLRPDQAGWYAGADPHSSYYGPPLRLADDARAFDVSPAWFSWIGTAPALEVVRDIGVDAIGQHNVTLANRFRAGVGLPDGDSAIVSTDLPDAEARLERAGIRAAVRGGRLRVSFHIYSTEYDVDLAVEALTTG